MHGDFLFTTDFTTGFTTGITTGTLCIRRRQVWRCCPLWTLDFHLTTGFLLVVPLVLLLVPFAYGDIKIGIVVHGGPLNMPIDKMMTHKSKSLKIST